MHRTVRQARRPGEQRGRGGQTNLVDLDEAEWQRIFDTNVRGMFLCSRAAGRHFATVGAGRVVNVAGAFGLLSRL